MPVMPRFCFVVAVATLVFFAGLASAVQWADVASAIAKLPAAGGSDPAYRGFPKDLTTLRAALDQLTTSNTCDAAFEKLCHYKDYDYLGKIKALRANYLNEKHDKIMPRRQVIVVGADPTGLATAFMIASKAKHKVIVVEKSNGKSGRWTGMLVEQELAKVLKDQLGLELDASGWIGQVSEFEYVMATALQLMGVEIKYNTMYMRMCPEEEPGNATPVHFVQTPEAKEFRDRIFTEDEACGDSGKTFRETHKLAGFEVLKGQILIGADGANSAVRQTLLAEEEAGKPKPTFVPVTATKGKFLTGPKGDTAVFFEAPLGQHLLTHIVLSVAAADDEHEAVRKALENAVATITVKPGTDEELKKLLDHTTTSITAVDFSKLVGSGIVHDVPIVSETGDKKRRLYVELLLRPGAAKHFHQQYDSILASTDVILQAASTYDQKFKLYFNDDKAKTELAKGLLLNLYKLLSTGVGQKNKFDKNLFLDKFKTADAFVKKIEKLNIYDQTLRGATKLADRQFMIKVLVGDAARDSYSAQPNAISSAYAAIEAFFAKLEGSEGGKNDEVAAEYKAALVDSYLNFASTDVYLRSFCGCEVAPDVHKLAFTLARCTFPPEMGEDTQLNGLQKNLKSRTGKTTCKAITLLQAAAADKKCDLTDPAEFKERITPFCDGSA